MTSQGDSDRDGAVFQNSNPFAGQEPDQHDQPEEIEEEDDTLTGVRSLNPFADDQAKQSTSGGDERLGTDSFAKDGNGASQAIETPPVDAISPGNGRGAFASTEYFGQSESSPRPFVPDKTDGVDHAVSASSNQPTNTDAPDDSLQELNSNVNGDRAERGTDVYACADPPRDTEDLSSGQDDKESESDSDSGHKDEKRITFAEKDNTENDDDMKKESTQSDSSPDMLDKIKTTVTNVKDKINLQQVSANGPLKFMNPTSARMRVRFNDDPDSDVGILWRSRDNRKGRNSVVIPRTAMAYPNLPSKNRPVYSSSFKGVRRNLYRMAFTFPYWDMAFWSGWSYTWGSVLFVIDGIWAWIPYGWPGEDEKMDPGIANYGIGVLFFVGAMLYQLGAVMAWLEAVNDGSFHGSAMKRFLEGHEQDKKRMLDEKVKSFFGHLNPSHQKRKHEEEQAELEHAKTVDPEAGWRRVPRRARPGSIYPTGHRPPPRRGGVDLGEAEEGETHEYMQWRWWPTWHAFRYHHIYEIGYIACSIQLFGATLYSWCGLDALHGLEDTWTPTEIYGAYWFPEILGSCCFLSASFMFILEMQEKWYKPTPNIMGWWIGFWAMIGSWGFLLNGIFGVIASAKVAHWAHFQSECSTTWGSFGYLCSALCQWYEAVNKHPIEEAYYDDDGDLQAFQIHET